MGCVLFPCLRPRSIVYNICIQMHVYVPAQLGNTNLRADCACMHLFRCGSSAYYNSSLNWSTACTLESVFVCTLLAVACALALKCFNSCIHSLYHIMDVVSIEHAAQQEAPLNAYTDYLLLTSAVREASTNTHTHASKHTHSTLSRVHTSTPLAHIGINERA